MDRKTEQFLMGLQEEIKIAPKLYWRFKQIMKENEKLRLFKKIVHDLHPKLMDIANSAVEIITEHN